MPINFDQRFNNIINKCKDVLIFAFVMMLFRKYKKKIQQLIDF